MATRAYTLRPEYEGKLVGGSVVSGTDFGTLHILDALKEGGGEIVTDDTFLQGVLDNYWGEYGLVFDVADASGEERVPIEKPGAPQVGHFGQPQGAQVPATSAASVPEAQHAEEASGYEGMSDDELRDTLHERNVPYSIDDTHEELIAALEDHDKEGETSNGS